jgi:hypothetical protein
LQKEAKILAGFIGLVTSAISQNFLRLPEWKFCARKIYSEPRRIFAVCGFLWSAKWCAPIIKALRAYSAFAEHNESVKRSLASRFRRIFVRHEQKSRARRSVLFQPYNGTDKAAKAGQAFSLLLPRFSFEQRKVRIK